MDQLKINRTLTMEITVVTTHLFIHSFIPFLLRVYYASNALLSAKDSKSYSTWEERAVKQSTTQLNTFSEEKAVDIQNKVMRYSASGQQ